NVGNVDALAVFKLDVAGLESLHNGQPRVANGDFLSAHFIGRSNGGVTVAFLVDGFFVIFLFFNFNIGSITAPNAADISELDNLAVAQSNDATARRNLHHFNAANLFAFQLSGANGSGFRGRLSRGRSEERRVGKERRMRKMKSQEKK